MYGARGARSMGGASHVVKSIDSSSKPSNILWSHTVHLKRGLHPDTTVGPLLDPRGPAQTQS